MLIKLVYIEKGTFVLIKENVDMIKPSPKCRYFLLKNSSQRVPKCIQRDTIKAYLVEYFTFGPVDC